MAYNMSSSKKSEGTLNTSNSLIFDRYDLDIKIANFGSVAFWLDLSAKRSNLA